MNPSVEPVARRSLANGFLPCRVCGSAAREAHEGGTAFVSGALRVEPAHAFEPMEGDELRALKASTRTSQLALMLLRQGERMDKMNAERRRERRRAARRTP